MVVMLPLILIPFVISGFLLVYALVGVVLEGDSLARWMNEAWSVTLPTTLIQTACCLCIVIFARNKPLPWTHMLNWSSIGHIGLVWMLAGLVYALSF